jgi:hypothetical protein
MGDAMIRLGILTDKNRERYDCLYFPDEDLAQAIGPLPERIGARGVAVSVFAKSEQEAREKLLLRLNEKST